MKDTIMKRLIVAAILMVVAIIFSVISWIILPDAVATQFKGLQTGAIALPKILAVLIAFAFSAAFSVLSVIQEEAVRYAFIGYGLHILFWICNL